LIEDSLIPENQISTDDFAGSLANQTNLAIKGIVGIKAMSQIASLLGDTAKSNNYSVSRSLLKRLGCYTGVLIDRNRPLLLTMSLNGVVLQHRLVVPT
jgi:hypothetical protein